MATTNDWRREKKNPLEIGSGFGELALTGLTHALPWMGKKVVEMGRFGASELLRNDQMQRKAVKFALEKSKPFLEKAAGDALDKLSVAIRPKNVKYKTDRADLDGRGLDVHSMIGKLPRPKKGFVPGKYKYMGPFNPLHKQLTYDPETGDVLKWHEKPFNQVDEISAKHDICYDMVKSGKTNKNDCDRKMVSDLDQIPYGEMPKWGQFARFVINTKQKLGMGLEEGNESGN